jgi:hypothetical protein
MTAYSWVERLLGNLPAYRRRRRGLWVWTPTLERPFRWTRLRSLGGRPQGQRLDNGCILEDYGR